MVGLRVACCSLPMLFAVSSALANGHFRECEACSRALESGSCQRESDVAGKRPPRYCRGYCIPKDVYYAMLETDPVTHEPGCEPPDLTCGGEFVLPYGRFDKLKGTRGYDGKVMDARED